MGEGCPRQLSVPPETGIDLQVVAAARSALIPAAVGRRSTPWGAPRHELKQVLKVGHALPAH